MKKITDFIVRRRNIIMVVFIFFAIVSVFLSQQVKINYEMTEYLPSDSETKIGMDIMEKEFDEEKESYLNIMFKNLTEDEKDNMYKKILEIDGVSSVDYEKESEEYNSNEYTLYVINVDDTDDSETAATVYDTVNNEFKDYEFYTSGSIKDRNMTILPTWILVLAVAIVAIILIIMCESYIEPFLFLVCIGIAVLLNNGTNIIFGTVTDTSMEDEIQITVIATGFEKNEPISSIGVDNIVSKTWEKKINSIPSNTDVSTSQNDLDIPAFLRKNRNKNL